jgi:predicted ATPase
VAAQSVELARSEGSASFALAMAHGFAGWVSMIAGEPGAARDRSAESLAIANEGGHEVRLVSAAVHGWSVGMLGDPATGAEEIEEAAAFLRRSRIDMFSSPIRALLADVKLASGEDDVAVRLTADALDEVERTGERWWEAELHRIRGCALARLGEDAAARAALRSAVDVAGRQGCVALLARARADLDALVG